MNEPPTALVGFISRDQVESAEAIPRTLEGWPQLTAYGIQHLLLNVSHSSVDKRDLEVRIHVDFLRA
jgi:hypothetical protein